MKWLWFVGALIVGWIILVELDKRKKLGDGTERHSILFIVRTGRGRDFISRLASHKRFWRIFGNIGVVVGISGMLLMFYAIGMLLYSKYYVGVQVPGFQAVIPGVTIPFWYGIAGLITVLVVHELSHGILAIAEGIPLKSAGIVFLTALPIGAFIEPDDDELQRKSIGAKLRVYSVGSFGNILLFILALALIVSFKGMFFGNPMINIVGVTEGSPADGVLEAGMVLTSINGMEVSSMQDFQAAVKDIAPDQTIVLTSEDETYTLIAAPKKGDPSGGYIGIYAKEDRLIKEGMSKHAYFILFWVAFLNQGIALVNLAPLHFGVAATDGHYILKEIIGRFIQEENAEKVTTFISTTTLIAVLLSIVNPLSLLG